MLVCLTMLVGTTFAWFTDSVTSGVNKIVAGNLDIEATVGGQSIEGIATLFNDVALWEPGAVAFENITVKNNGNLALMYKMSVNFTNENTLNGNGLSKALKVGVVNGGVNGNREAVIGAVSEWNLLADFELESKLTKNGDNDVYGVVIYWEPTANDNLWNVKNGQTTSDGQALHIDLGINIFATQYTYENDSFDETYDDGASALINNNLVEKKQTTLGDGTNGEAFAVYDILGTGNASSAALENITFDSYMFNSAKFDEKYPTEQYGDMLCDYFVSTDGPVKDGVYLIGQYDLFGDAWVAVPVPANTGKYDPTPLLGTVISGGVSNWTYQDIIDGVGEFNCGIINTNPENAGVKAQVDLRMTDPVTGDIITVTSITVTL